MMPPMDDSSDPTPAEGMPLLDAEPASPGVASETRGGWRVDPRCGTLETLARLEKALGFARNSRDYRKLLRRCRDTGACAAPGVCAGWTRAVSPIQEASVFTPSFAVPAARAAAAKGAEVIDL